MLGWFGYSSWIGVRDMATAQFIADTNALAALYYNNEAINVFPYPVTFRRQINGTLATALASSPGNIVIDPDSADFIYRIGQTASPWDTSVLISRIQYLMYAGRITEMPPLIAMLKKVAPRNRKTFVADGLYHEAQGEKSQAIESARIGLEQPANDPADEPMLQGILQRNAP